MSTAQLNQNAINDFFNEESSQKSKRFQSSDFINSIIHEIKNPLNAIICFSEFLRQEVKNPKLVEECADYAMEISQAANDLSDIVDDLLDVGSIVLCSPIFNLNLREYFQRNSV